MKALTLALIMIMLPACSSTAMILGSALQQGGANVQKQAQVDDIHHQYCISSGGGYQTCMDQ